MARPTQGKFRSMLDSAVYTAILDWGADEEVSAEGLGWAARMNDGGAMAKAMKEQRDELFDVTEDELAELRREGSAGVVLYEHDNGIVDVYYFDKKKDLEAGWKEFEEELSFEEEDDYEENPGRSMSNAKNDNIIFSGGGFVGHSHPRGMIIKPTAEGQADAQEAWESIEDHELGPDDALYGLLEYWIGNGWTWIPPEAIGALTDAPIISPDATIEDDGSYTIYPGGSVYWHSNYAVEDPVEKWARGEGVVWDVSRAIEENPNQREVISAWAAGKKSRASALRTDGTDLYSYDLLIGTREGGRLVVYDYTGANKISATTSKHVGAAKGVADEIHAPPERKGRWGNPTPNTKKLKSRLLR